jgi:predicted RNA-binding Zn-ribbon protein involved in translation (DUF1610 family)
MAAFICPHCSVAMSQSQDTYNTQTPSFSSSAGKSYEDRIKNNPLDPSTLEIEFYRCPECGKYTILANGYGSAVKDVHVTIYPSSLAKKFPDYVPKIIRQDYEEAYAIVDLSPKASATLSRRCLQAMIRDFWKVEGENSLYNEIEAIKSKVPQQQWKILDSIRRVGNIGAHPEPDVNLIIDIKPEGAQKLISVIELLIKQWYIDHHEQEQLFEEVLKLDRDTQSQRTKG